MGIDIAQYRARIGTFKSCRVCHSIDTSCCSRDTTSVNVSDIILCVFGVIEFIRILLVINGVEQNPGPTSPKIRRKNETQGHIFTFDGNVVSSGVSRSLPERSSMSSSVLQNEDDVGPGDQKTTSGSYSDSSMSTRQPTSREQVTSQIEPNGAEQRCGLDVCRDLRLSGNTSQQVETFEEENPRTVQQQGTCNAVDDMSGLDVGDLVNTECSNEQSQVMAVQSIVNTLAVNTKVRNVNLSVNIEGCSNFAIGKRNTFINEGQHAEMISDHKTRVQEDTLERNKQETSHRNRTSNEAEVSEKNPLKKNLQDEAQSRIDNTPNTIERSGTYEVIKCLKENKLAIVTGLSGEGKSSVAIQVLKKLQTGYQDMEPLKPIVINFPEQWNQVVNTKDRCIAFIDDIFGKSNLNRNLLIQWMSLMEADRSMETTIKKGNVFILITSRNNIYQEAVKHINLRDSLLSEKCVIDLTRDFPLNYYEKKQMLMKHEQQLDSCINEILYEPPNPLYGFPLLCHFLRNLLEQSTIVHSIHPAKIFKNPRDLISEDINRMKSNEPNKYFALVYCFLQDSQTVDKAQLNPFNDIKAEIRQNMSKIAAACCYESNDLVSDLRGAFNSMLGFYVSERDFTFMFHHQSINEAVCLVFGKEYPEMILQRCSESFIMEMVCLTDDEQQNQNRLVITDHLYTMLAQRVAESLQKKQRMKSFLHLSSIGFIKVLFSHFKELQFCPSDLLFDCANSVNHISEFYRGDLYKMYVATNGKALYFQEVIRSVDEAITNDNVSTYKLLLEKGGYVSSSHLTTASRYRSVDIVKFLLSRYTLFTEYEIFMALRDACRYDNSELVQFFLNKRLVPDEYCVHLALQSDSTETLKLLVPDGRFPRETMNKFLVDAYKQNANTDILKHLVFKGAVHTPACLSACFSFGDPIFHLSRRFNSKYETKSTNPKTYIFSFSWSNHDIGNCLLDLLGRGGIPEELFHYIQKREHIFDERVLIKACLYGLKNFSQYILSHLKLSLDNFSMVIDNLLRKTAVFYTKNDYDVCAVLKMVSDAGYSFTIEHLLKAVQNKWPDSLKLMLSRQEWKTGDLMSIINEVSETDYAGLISILVEHCGEKCHEYLLESIRFRNVQLVTSLLKLKCWDEDQLSKAGKELCLMLNSDLEESTSYDIIESKSVILNAFLELVTFQIHTFSHILEILMITTDYVIHINGNRFLQCCKDLCLENDQRVIKIAALHNEHEFVESHIEMLSQDQRDEIPSYLSEKLPDIHYIYECDNESLYTPSPDLSIEMLKCLRDAGCKFQIQFLKVNKFNESVVHFLLSEKVFPSDMLTKSMDKVIPIACINSEYDFVKSHIHLLTKDQLNEISFCLSNIVYEQSVEENWWYDSLSLPSCRLSTEILQCLRDAGCPFQIQFLEYYVQDKEVIHFLLNEKVFSDDLLQTYMYEVIPVACICEEYDFVKSHIHLLTQDQLNKIPDKLHELLGTMPVMLYDLGQNAICTEVLECLRGAGCQFQPKFLVKSVQRENSEEVKYLITNNIFPQEILEKEMQEVVQKGNDTYFEYPEEFTDFQLIEYVLYQSLMFCMIEPFETILKKFNWSHQQLDTCIDVLFRSRYHVEDIDMKSTTVVEMLVENGLTFSTKLLNRFVCINDLEVVAYLIEKGAYSPYDLSKSLTLACQRNHELLVRFMHSEGVAFEENCLENSKYDKRSFELEKFVVSNLKHPEKWYSKLLHQAIVQRDTNRMLYLHSLGGVINLTTETSDMKASAYHNIDFHPLVNSDFKYYYRRIRAGCFTYIRKADL